MSDLIDRKKIFFGTRHAPLDDTHAPEACPKHTKTTFHTRKTNKKLQSIVKPGS